MSKKIKETIYYIKKSKAEIQAITDYKKVYKWKEDYHIFFKNKKEIIISSEYISIGESHLKKLIEKRNELERNILEAEYKNFKKQGFSELIEDDTQAIITYRGILNEYKYKDKIKLFVEYLGYRADRVEKLVFENNTPTPRLLNVNNLSISDMHYLKKIYDYSYKISEHYNFEIFANLKHNKRFLSNLIGREDKVYQKVMIKYDDGNSAELRNYIEKQIKWWNYNIESRQKSIKEHTERKRQRLKEMKDKIDKLKQKVSKKDIEYYTLKIIK